jgi:poly-gamma-glutamate synthesis protein (capsule biosynthesis protein)
MVGVCHYEAKALKEVRLYPIDLGFGRPIPQRGRPVLAQGDTAQAILAWLQTLSEPFGTQITIDGDVGVIRP